MALSLYRVDGRGRVNLDGMVPAGVEFYTVERPSSADGAPDGTLILTPVTVVTTATKRAEVQEQAAADPTETNTATVDTPWDDQPTA